MAMAVVYVVVEVRNGEAGRPFLEALSEARRQVDGKGGTVVAVAIGSGGESANLGRYGADEVRVLDQAELSTYNLEAYASAVAEVVEKEPGVAVFLPATVHGRELAGWLSARLQTGVAADVTKVEMDASGRITANRPMYSGKVRS